MPRYRINYKAYYHEHSEYWHEDVEAESPPAALRAFFMERLESTDSLDDYDGDTPKRKRDVDPERVRSWWEGDWLFSYRGISESDLVPCPVCDGRGEVTERQATSLVGSVRS